MIIDGVIAVLFIGQLSYLMADNSSLVRGYARITGYHWIYALDRYGEGARRFFNRHQNVANVVSFLLLIFWQVFIGGIAFYAAPYLLSHSVPLAIRFLQDQATAKILEPGSTTSGLNPTGPFRVPNRDETSTVMGQSVTSSN